MENKFKCIHVIFEFTQVQFIDSYFWYNKKYINNFIKLLKRD